MKGLEETYLSDLYSYRDTTSCPRRCPKSLWLLHQPGFFTGVIGHSPYLRLYPAKFSDFFFRSYCHLFSFKLSWRN